MDHVNDLESEELCVEFEDVETVKVVELLKKWQSGEKSVNLKRLDLSNVGEDEYQPLIEMLDKLDGVSESRSRCNWEQQVFYAEKYPKHGLFIANRAKVIKYEEGGLVLLDYQNDN
ncbi:hypothetical protein CAEBREN_04261 [Caenorhabditis brenneri]|uniref:Uncharacterized protein n=1 Tax=Caenorhabditis brenneri TaxID=135651 RepID=G0NK00_CAEBE|nr:hypothetical protein CAEBREN_04261 [Caenorhabditis brenneri]